MKTFIKLFIKKNRYFDKKFRKLDKFVGRISLNINCKSF